jgi:hypothetical protein
MPGCRPEHQPVTQLRRYVQVHVLPRWFGDGLVPLWTVTSADPDERAAIAERILGR